jgi:3-oxoadipate enol-lactonase/4-carboxymuconolactone decarboxylase
LKIVDRGSGVPIVVIPGIQGRWEWMKSGVDALAQRSRVITFSFCDEPTSGGRFDPASGFWSYVDQVRDALDALAIERAAICGVSYGGLVAAAFAARYPDRVASLVLVSALPPSWQPDERVAFYVRFPWLLTPLFCVGSLRLYAEIAAASGGWRRGGPAALGHGLNVLRHMFHPARMARRVHLLSSVRIEPELARVKVPVLVITGEDALERVVAPRMTHQYVNIWPHAQVATLERTGHLGLITRPTEFATLVSRFAGEHASAEPRCRIQDPAPRIPDPGSPVPPEQPVASRRRVG